MALSNCFFSSNSDFYSFFSNLVLPERPMLLILDGNSEMGACKEQCQIFNLVKASDYNESSKKIIKDLFSFMRALPSYISAML